MACQFRTKMLWWGFSIPEIGVSERSCITRATCALQNWTSEPSCSGRISNFGIKSVPLLITRFHNRTYGWRVALALDTGGIPGDGGQERLNSNGSDFGGTRLGRIASTGSKQLLEKLNSARKNFPMKIFLLLLGFYTANALATILGQTGDWDVLVAGVVVAAIEGIGMLVYKKPSSLSTGRLQSFVVMMNYWKAGVCLGLFVDAFKLGS